MTWFSDIVATMAFSQLALLGVYFLTHYRGVLPRLISLFCMCLAAYALATMSFAEVDTLPSYLLYRLATLAPFLLWLIAFHLFVDMGRVPAVAWFAMAFFVIVRGIGSGVTLGQAHLLESTLPFIVVQLIPQLILLFFSVHAIYLAYQGYSADLLEQRRQLRVGFVVFMGVLISVIVGRGVIDAYIPNQIPNVVFTFFLLIGAFLFNLFSFRLSNEAMTLVSERVVQPRNQDTPLPAQPEVDPRLMARISELMETEKLYMQQGLTIADLAEALKMQEYRLRRLINQTMQYRNFNQFLNNYRIREASRLLATTRTPISSIALDVGYSSLSVFNKAFKERFGMTPSAYRQQHGGDDPADSSGKVSALKTQPEPAERISPTEASL